MPNSEKLATRRCLIVCTILISLVTVMFSACFAYHLLVKDLCYAHAHARLVDGKIEWNWNIERCVGKIQPVNTTAVRITSPGVYIIDIQICSTCFLADIELKIPSNKNYVSGSFNSSPDNTMYARMSQILLVNKNDELSLTLNGGNCVSTHPKSTQWKLLKVKDI